MPPRRTVSPVERSLGTRPGRQKLLDRALEPLDALLGEADRFHHLLQDNLVRRMVELLLLQPAQVAHAPVRARSAAVETLRVHKQQVSAFMLKHGRHYPRRKATSRLRKKDRQEGLIW